MDRREHIIELSQQILGLRNQLHILESELDTLIGTPPVVASMPRTPLLRTPQGEVLPPSAHLEEPVADRIIRILELQRDREFDARTMFEELGLPEERFPTVRSTLHRLASEERIVRSSAGRFAALIRRNQAGIAQPDNPGESNGVRNATA